jgi:hypothetical protein
VLRHRIFPLPSPLKSPVPATAQPPPVAKEPCASACPPAPRRSAVPTIGGARALSSDTPQLKGSDSDSFAREGKGSTPGVPSAILARVDREHLLVDPVGIALQRFTARDRREVKDLRCLNQGSDPARSSKTRTVASARESAWVRALSAVLTLEMVVRLWGPPVLFR